jgi:uncharacterized YigZ family protein
MLDKDIYKTIRAEAGGLYREKGSRFISLALPVSSENEIRSLINGIRKEHHEARHHCYAWVLGINGDKWRANDDGEPSRTAGYPILGQIRSHGLTNILIVVSRYFGGTLLGKSGLTNAYRSAALSALENSEIIEHIVLDYWEISFPYTAMNDVMKIIKEEGIDQSGHSFDLDCRLTVHFRSSERDRLLARFALITGLTYHFIVSI